MSFWKSFLAVGTGLSCAMGLMHTPFSTAQQTVIPEQPLGCHLILPPALPVQLITADCAPAPQAKNALSTAPAESGTIPHHTTSCTVAATTTYPTTFSTPATTQTTCITQADLQIAASSECSSNAAAESSVEDPIPPTAEATCSAPLLTQQTNPDGFAVLQTMETWFKTYGLPLHHGFCLHPISAATASLDGRARLAPHSIRLFSCHGNWLAGEWLRRTIFRYIGYWRNLYGTSRRCESRLPHGSNALLPTLRKRCQRFGIHCRYLCIGYSRMQCWNHLGLSGIFWKHCSADSTGL